MKPNKTVSVALAFIWFLLCMALGIALLHLSFERLPDQTRLLLPLFLILWATGTFLGRAAVSRLWTISQKYNEEGNSSRVQNLRLVRTISQALEEVIGTREFSETIPDQSEALELIVESMRRSEEELFVLTPNALLISADMHVADDAAREEVRDALQALSAHAPILRQMLREQSSSLSVVLPDPKSPSVRSRIEARARRSELNFAVGAILETNREAAAILEQLRVERETLGLPPIDIVLTSDYLGTFVVLGDHDCFIQERVHSPTYWLRKRDHRYSFEVVRDNVLEWIKEQQIQGPSESNGGIG